MLRTWVQSSTSSPNKAFTVSEGFNAESAESFACNSRIWEIFFSAIGSNAASGGGVGETATASFAFEAEVKSRNS